MRAVPSLSDAGAHGVTRPTSVTRPVSPRSAVALVITLIMISVITFLAITFLALARRERGQVTTTLDQTTAKFAADTAQDRALAELLATILQHTNIFSPDLLVSTNFINPLGFDPAAFDSRTNVNFDYTIANAALSGNQPMENLTHLLYNPRAPVFLTNKFFGSNEFRYYLDLNRDGTPTRNGWLVVTNPNGGFYDLNGLPISAFTIQENQLPPTNILVRHFTGDPEFIGILLRPEFEHSPSNQFLSRYAYIVIPAGKTLDVNYVHNAARYRALNPNLDPAGGDVFRRNQGVNSWENNLASFLVDLNTNAWPGPFQLATALGSPYVYAPDGGVNNGAAFDDALSFMRFRYGTRRLLYPSYSFQNVYDPARALAMRNDYVDAYALSPLVSNTFGLNLDLDPNYTPATAWGGSEKPNHLFTTQDFFDQSKLPLTFANRLMGATTNSVSSYDRYTYYRMMSQLGTDSAPEPNSATDPGGRLNLNFVNIAPFRTTNFVSWRAPAVQSTLGRPGSELFFSNAVDRLVRRYTTDWRNQSFVTFTNTFGTNQPFGADHIPVFVNGRFVYPASLHRQLQVAANLWDAVNGATNPALPTVFRPRFTREGLNIFINDFVEVTRATDLTGTLRDLSNTNVAANVQPDDLLFGVPLVVGVRKGLPNFNEFASEAVVQVTRKLELVKSAPGGGNMIYQTNQMLVIGISNVFGAEFWNSYTTNYPRSVHVQVTNYCQLALTNDYGYRHLSNLVAGAQFNTNNWVAWKPKIANPPATGPWSFVVPLRTNHVILPDSVYRFGANTFDQLTSKFEEPSGSAFPRWGLTITNRVVAFITDVATGKLIDYVQLNGIVSHQDISAAIAQPRTGVGFAGVWGTNSTTAAVGRLSGLPGIIQQIQISKGEVEPGGNWQNYGVGQPSGATRDQAVANFLAFFEPSHTYSYQLNGRSFFGTNYGTVAIAPFTPTTKFSIPMIYQANDPLVHYTTGDLEDVDRSGIMVRWTPPTTNQVTLENLGKLNTRFQPWGGNPLLTSGGTSSAGNPLDFQTAAKDPGIRRSDDWQFPTNHLPTLGWLGRIHRGTPWQTVYLKSTRAEEAVAGKATVDKINDWQRWTGNRTVWRNGAAVWNDAYLSQPEQDRNWLELFTTALNESATQGQLPINQTGLAAWSAVFGGMVALTNTAADQYLNDYGGPSAVGPWFIDPAGTYDPATSQTNALPAVAKIVKGINDTRADKNLYPSQTFTRLGHLLATPELSEKSPLLNFGTVGADGHNVQREYGLTDTMVEWLPQQMLSLVRLGEPRFVIYSFGQTLKPAPRSIQVSGPYSQMCTNYQITAEVATRSVVKVIGSPDPRQTGNADPDQNYPPRIVVESFNVLPPD